MLKPDKNVAITTPYRQQRQTGQVTMTRDKEEGGKRASKGCWGATTTVGIRGPQ